MLTSANSNNNGSVLVVSTTDATKNITANIDTSKINAVTFEGSGGPVVSGNISGNGVITNTANTSFTGDNSAYTGTYTQTSGSINQFNRA